MSKKITVVPALFLVLTLLTSCSEKPVSNEVYCNAIDGLFSDEPPKNIGQHRAINKVLSSKA